MDGWQPIETAPKDGTVILGRITLPDGERTAVLKWDAAREGWCQARSGSALLLFPQEWMPATPSDQNSDTPSSSSSMSSAEPYRERQIKSRSE